MVDEGGRIVVGVDGSAAARTALRWAVRQARLTDAVLDAVIAWEFPIFSLGQVLLPPEDPETIAGRRLAEAVRETVGPDPGVDVRQHALAGHPAQVLAETATGAGLLVVGSRGHGAFAAALLGSVAQYCVQHAPCPVVVVRGTWS